MQFFYIFSYLDLDEAQRAALLERAIRVLADDRSENPVVKIES